MMQLAIEGLTLQVIHLRLSPTAPLHPRASHLKIDPHRQTQSKACSLSCLRIGYRRLATAPLDRSHVLPCASESMRQDLQLPQEKSYVSAVLAYGSLLAKVCRLLQAWRQLQREPRKRMDDLDTGKTPLNGPTSQPAGSSAGGDQSSRSLVTIAGPATPVGSSLTPAQYRLRKVALITGESRCKAWDAPKCTRAG